jgi:hypothetical protein
VWRLDHVLLMHVQGFVDLAYTPDGALVEENARVWQFSLALVKAEGVGPTGPIHFEI